MIILKILKKNFANKVVSIPPKLKGIKGKQENKKKLSPVYNLLKSEKLAESKSEKLNVQEKLDYECVVKEASNRMLLNYFKIYDDKEVKEKELNNLRDYIEKVLNPTEISLFLNEFKQAKKIIDKESVEKTEEIFKFFIDKIYNLCDNKMVSKTLISLLSNLSLKEISADEIFKNSTKSEISIKSNKQDGIPIQRSIYYSQLESNYSTILNIRNPITNDLDKPESDFKDAFLMKHDYTLQFPILIQKNTNQTKFDFSNYVYFTSMPLFYPIKNLDTNETEIKHLNNEIIYKNRFNIKKSRELKNFVTKYLKRALEEGMYSQSDFLNPVNNKNLKIEITSCYASKAEFNDYYDMNMINESVDFIEELFENTEESKDEKMLKINRYRTYKAENVKDEEEILNIEKIINSTKYVQLRKTEIEKYLGAKMKENLFCSGLICFNNYEEKKHFLKSAAGVFGIYLQGKNITFCDADFCNYLDLNIYMDEIKLHTLKNMLNLKFREVNLHNLLLDVPNYVNEIAGESLQNITAKNSKIIIRFNSFLNALKAIEFFNNESSSKVNYFLFIYNQIFTYKFSKPMVRYYNGHFFSGMELVLKNTISNLEKLINVPSNYCEINNILEKEII